MLLCHLSIANFKSECIFLFCFKMLYLLQLIYFSNSAWLSQWFVSSALILWYNNWCLDYGIHVKLSPRIDLTLTFFAAFGSATSLTIWKVMALDSSYCRMIMSKNQKGIPNYHFYQKVVFFKSKIVLPYIYSYYKNTMMLVVIIVLLNLGLLHLIRK